MLTMAVMMWARKTGVVIDGMASVLVADLILAWIVMSGLVKIFG